MGQGVAPSTSGGVLVTAALGGLDEDLGGNQVHQSTDERCRQGCSQVFVRRMTFVGQRIQQVDIGEEPGSHADDTNIPTITATPIRSPNPVFKWLFIGVFLSPTSGGNV